MPRLPRISSIEVIRVLERLDFYQARQTGSHVVLKKPLPDGEIVCVVPLIAAVVSGTIIGYQKTRSPTPRAIYEFIFNGETQYLAVTVGDNGYIVGANPAPRS